MLQVEREYFEAERKALLTPRKHSNGENSIHAKKTENEIDKYFVLANPGPVSTGYGVKVKNLNASKRAAHEKLKRVQMSPRPATAKKEVVFANSVKPSRDFNENNRCSDANENNRSQRSRNMPRDQKSSGPSLKMVKDADDIIYQQARLHRDRGKNIEAFGKHYRNSNQGSAHQVENLRFQLNLKPSTGRNWHRASTNAAGVDESPKSNSNRPKKLTKSQITSVDRLARSRWRRDPIHERLLFLTGHTKHQVEDPDYVKHLDYILQAKHDQMEGHRIAELAEIERDREWLWSVKYDLDFSDMERETLERHREERKDAAEAELNRQDAMFSSAGKQTFYTVATRTHGLDRMRNINELRQMHENVMRDNVEKGQANPRRTWMLHAMENEDEDLAEFRRADNALDLYLGSEKIIQDTMTLEEQKDEDGEEEEEQGGTADGDDDDY